MTIDEIARAMAAGDPTSWGASAFNKARAEIGAYTTAVARKAKAEALREAAEDIVAIGQGETRGWLRRRAYRIERQDGGE